MSTLYFAQQTKLFGRLDAPPENGMLYGGVDT